MKTAIAAYAISALLIIFVIANSFILSFNINKVIEKLEDTPNSPNEAQTYIDIYDDYMRRQKYISLTVNHDDLSTIETSFFEMLGAIEANDEESLIIAKSRLLGALSHLKRLSGINMDSIF